MRTFVLLIASHAVQSYVGVQLILALDIIRDLAAAEGHAVGPILTLSYKNHALDEILLDILKHGPGNFKRSRALVRCGNAEDVSLKPFTEQRTQAEREAQVFISLQLVLLHQTVDQR